MYVLVGIICFMAGIANFAGVGSELLSDTEKATIIFISLALIIQAIAWFCVQGMNERLKTTKKKVSDNEKKIKELKSTIEKLNKKEIETEDKCALVREI